MAKTTSKEKIIIERFTPYKIIEIFRNGKKIYSLKTSDTTANLADLKRKYRHDARTRQGEERLRRLAVADEENNLYSYMHWLYFKNMAEEYNAIKQLKAQLERQHAGAIQLQTATYTKDYNKQFKIVYVNWIE